MAMREASRKNGTLRNLRNKGPMPRRFPPPWSIEELEACFVVKDTSGQKLAYVYFEDEPGRRSAAKLLSKRMRRDVSRRKW